MTLFLSYSHQDKDIAHKLATILRSRGYHIWFDNHVAIGGDIPTEVAEALNASDYLLLLLTKNSLSSQWMRAELDLYLMDRPPGARSSILALRLDETSPSEFSPWLKHLRWADFRSDFNAGINQLIEDLKRHPTPLSVEAAARLQFAIDLAVQAGTTAMRYYNSVLNENQTLEDRKNAATTADRAAQHLVVKNIVNHAQYGHDAIIGEEPPYSSVSVNMDGFTWVLDPVDGTTNFRHRIPLFCSAIGVLKDGLPYIGVIYDPNENEVFYAAEGQRTTLWRVQRGERSEVKADQRTIELKGCLIGTHISGREEPRQRLFEDNLLSTLAGRVENIRALGSGQLALAYVASGRLQAYLQFGSALWDQVAGIVLVRNSGGICIHLPSGEEWTARNERTDFCAVANNELRAELSRHSLGMHSAATA